MAKQIPQSENRLESTRYILKCKICESVLFNRQKMSTYHNLFTVSQIPALSKKSAIYLTYQRLIFSEASDYFIPELEGLTYKRIACNHCKLEVGFMLLLPKELINKDKGGLPYEKYCLYPKKVQSEVQLQQQFTVNGFENIKEKLQSDGVSTRVSESQYTSNAESQSDEHQEQAKELEKMINELNNQIMHEAKLMRDAVRDKDKTDQIGETFDKIEQSLLEGSLVAKFKTGNPQYMTTSKRESNMIIEGLTDHKGNPKGARMGRNQSSINFHNQQSKENQRKLKRQNTSKPVHKGEKEQRRGPLGQQKYSFEDQLGQGQTGIDFTKWLGPVQSSRNVAVDQAT